MKIYIADFSYGVCLLLSRILYLEDLTKLIIENIDEHEER